MNWAEQPLELRLLSKTGLSYGESKSTDQQMTSMFLLLRLMLTFFAGLVQGRAAAAPCEYLYAQRKNTAGACLEEGSRGLAS